VLASHTLSFEFYHFGVVSTGIVCEWGACCVRRLGSFVKKKKKCGLLGAILGVFSQYRACVSAVFCMVFHLNMPWTVSALALECVECYGGSVTTWLSAAVSVSLTCVV
jgi:hypothetical protein